jgi:hypothetical protein
MHTSQARQFILNVLNAPDVPYAQMMVNKNHHVFDQNFFNTLENMIEEMTVRAQSYSSQYSPGASLGYLNGIAGGAQKAQHYYRGLLMLREYVKHIEQQRQMSYAGAGYGDYDIFEETYEELDETYEPYEGYEDEEYYGGYAFDGNSGFGSFRWGRGEAFSADQNDLDFLMAPSNAQDEIIRGEPDEKAARRQQLNNMMDDMLAYLGGNQKDQNGKHMQRVLTLVQELKFYLDSQAEKSDGSTGSSGFHADVLPPLARLISGLERVKKNRTAFLHLERKQARPLARKIRDYVARARIGLIQPIWFPHKSRRDANTLFFSGPSYVSQVIRDACAELGMNTHVDPPPGQDYGAVRWADLASAGSAVFDISDASPQVYYELGIALTLGTPLTIIGRYGTRIPFDIGHELATYPGSLPNNSWLQQKMDEALYGPGHLADQSNCLESTLAMAVQLSEGYGPYSAQRGAAILLEHATSDALGFKAALHNLNDLLQEPGLVVHPRWPIAYPAAQGIHGFTVMPANEPASSPCFEHLHALGGTLGITSVFGHHNTNHHTIPSVWTQICKATHVVVDLTNLHLDVCLQLGMAHTLGRKVLMICARGTENRLFANIAYRPCHTYDPKLALAEPEFLNSVVQFYRVR